MTEPSPAITISHPPKAVIRIGNPIIMLLLRTPFAGAAGTRFIGLSFTGRKTGRQFSIPLSAHLVDGVLYALTPAKWKYNFRGDGATARVRYAGKTTTMRGVLIEDQALIADLYSRLAQSYGVKLAERSMGLAFREHRMPTREQFAEAVEELVLRAIRFTPAP